MNNVKEISGWQTTDGEVHSTRAYAVRRQAELDMTEILRREYIDIDPDDFIQFLSKNSNLINIWASNYPHPPISD